MFQYAFGKALAHFYATDFVLDVQDFKRYALRNFELQEFAIDCKLASKWQVFLYGNSIFHKGIRHLLGWSSKKYYAEK